jgi:serine/threonine-protein kinase
MGVIAGGEQLCSACGTPVPASDTTVSASTAAAASGSPPPASAVDLHAAAGGRSPFRVQEQGHVSLGTVVAGRYRVLELLGQGGMGEVYRANDLKLGQTIALKFLTKNLAADPARTSRLLHEVRLARQVSHPNVCRVYDVGDDQGEHFISMEYVRGEDLRRLLRRIGRFPHDKAVQIARQLCAGLAAAHAEGILHRDLKPANVMLDDRGVAHIMDFGLAVLAEQEGGAREGTPAYMAPEQLTGGRLSVRSDLYSLGLVLYELFTGQRVFRGQTPADLLRERSSGPASPSRLVADLDPAVERVIVRCLEPQPQRRPVSALAVSVMLPGADALTEAMAAGDTPSPSLVAAAETEGLRPPVAVACLAGVCVSLGLVVALSGDIADHLHADYAPQGLATKGRELLRRLGYRAASADAAGGFQLGIPYLRHAQATQLSSSGSLAAPGAATPSIVYWYRQSPHHLVSTDFFSIVSADSPAPVVAGMVGIELDPQGRLISLQAMPPQVEEPTDAAGEPDWSMLFDAGGLDLSRFQPVPPRWTPLGFAEIRRAWEGRHPDRPDVPIRVEAAGYRGLPVGFTLVTAWTDSRRAGGTPARVQTRAGASVQVVRLGLLLALLAAGGILTYRNLTQRRGDRRGAARLAVFVVTLVSAVWLLKADHAPTTGEFLQFVIASGWALSLAAMIWLFYIATEPYIRRRWPRMLISWSRLLAGDWRDSLVGRDVLVGTLAGIATLAARQVYLWLGHAPSRPIDTLNLRMLLGLPQLLAEAMFRVPAALFWGLGGAFLLLLLAGLLRRDWLASVAFLLLFVVPLAVISTVPWVTAVYAAAVWTGRLMLLFRFGVLANVTHWLVWLLVDVTPLTTHLTGWYSGPTFFAVFFTAGIASWGFVRSLGGRGLSLDDLFARKA